MITRKVVLVLGAGASAPFGFPLGRELKRRMVDRLISSNPEYRPLISLGFTPEQIETFRSTLWKSGKPSVDAFLEHRVDFLEIGKAATACFLLPCESEPSLFGGPQSWYDYLSEKLNTKFEEFDRNSLSILTFNYDRSLEHYLFTTLSNSYRKSPQECAEKVRSLQIVHLYGQLGAYPSLADDGSGVGYGSQTLESLRKAADGIHIIHESVDSEPFRRAHALIMSAERICFVGFGYHSTNLERLLGYKKGGQKHPEVWGAARGLTQEECRLVQNSIKNLGFSAIHGFEYVNGEALPFLRTQCPLD